MSAQMNAKFTVYKTLRLEVEVEAATAQEAYEAQLDMDDTTFTVLACDYEVFDVNNNDVTDEVDIR